MNFIHKHPMDVNVNTVMRWHEIKQNIKNINFKDIDVLDVGSGLGFFSLKFKELGANVLAIDIDKNSLDYLESRYKIKTSNVNVENGIDINKKFDLIFIGEILEHIKDPSSLLKNISQMLSNSGQLIVTTPALEGWLTDSKGKKMCHEDGHEKHLRDGFSMGDLLSIGRDAGLQIVWKENAIFTFAELFMQLTKLFYKRKKKAYASQHDIINLMNTVSYKALFLLFTIVRKIFAIESFFSKMLGIKGHCHIICFKNVDR
ncbi:MAG: methyltransferase domain-containing protein [Oligoflexia bacterium]|nr:methyltransferase domain-containing protein [Oligoflexia bacterium]